MLRLRRRPAKTHARLVKEELSESLDHFVQAASHAAGGVGATVGPKVDLARERVGPAADKVRAKAAAGLGTTAAALAPIAVKARNGGRRAIGKKPIKQPRRWPRMAGLLMAGAAVGAASALVLRYRRRQQWEEYDPSRAADPVTSAGGAGASSSRPSESITTDELAGRASSGIDTIDTSTSRTGLTPPNGIATPVPGGGLSAKPPSS